MTNANLASIMGAVLIACGMILVLVQFFRPPANNQNTYGALVTIIIVGAVLLGVGAFGHG
jgi:hypothetical protein